MVSNSRLKPTIFFLVMALFLAVYIYGHYDLMRRENNQSEKLSRVVAARINDAVEAELSAPIKVSKSMATNVYLIKALDEETKIGKEDMESYLSKFLAGIKESSDYNTAFVISDKTRRYYSSDGINRIVNSGSNYHDVWYNNFIESEAPLVLDVDVDEANDYKWTVFIYARIEDEQGHLLGVCGVGVVMSEIQEVFEKYQDEYDIKISLIDKNGLIQADTNTFSIENTHSLGNILPENDEYVYTPKGRNGYIITKYIDELDWYMVVSGESSVGDFNPLYLIFGMAFYIIMVSVYTILFKGETLQGTNVDKSARADLLTGLSNRNYFEEMYGDDGTFSTIRYKTMAVVSIDYFAEICKNVDGDAVLSYVVTCMKRHLIDRGEIFRWSRDEFVVFMEWSMDFASEISRELCEEIEKDGRTTVSIGLIEVNMSKPIKTNYYRAVKNCYLVKEMGGNGVKLG